MRPSIGSCFPPRRTERRHPTAALLAAFLAAGCVLPGTHAEVVDERDALRGERARLEKRVQLLEASNESLSGERVTLLDQVEDLRLTGEELAARRADLEGQVAELTTRRDELAADLASRTREVEEEQQEVDELRSTYDELVTELQSEVAAGRIEIERLREGLQVKLSQEILFPKGSARVSAGGRGVLERVAGRLGGEGHAVQVLGHTDPHAIRGRLAQQYPSNWELGAARAAAVVRILEGAGVASARLSAISHGPHRPVASNDSAEGRARNRRIEIRLQPEPGTESQAPTAAE